MRRHFFLIFSRALTTTSLPTSRSHQFSHLHFTHDFLALLSTLSLDRTNPKTLTNLDSMLSQYSHLLDSNTSVLVLRGLSLTRKLTRAKSILSNLNSRNNIPQPFLYSLALQCLIPNGTISDAESIWREITSSDDSLGISDFVLHLCRHGETVSVIEQVFRQISSSGCKLSRQAYVALIGAMCRGKEPNPSTAKKVLNEMEENGFEPDSITYFVLFRSFCEVSNVFEADTLLREWRKRWDFELDVNIYGNFLSGLCKSGRFREARKLFDKLTVKDRVFQIKSNSNALPKAGRRAIFQMTYVGAIPEMMAFEAYFRSVCSSGKMDEAERLMKLIMKKSTVPEICVYTCFIKALFRNGRVNDAVKFFRAERKKGFVSGNDIAVAVIFGFCEVGRVEEGYRLLHEMVSEGFVPSVRIWNRILASYWKCGNVEKAKDLFDRMSSGSTRIDGESYGVMILGFLEKGEVDIGVSLLKEMVREKLEISVDLYGAVVRGLYACGRIEEANEYLSTMIEKGVLGSYAAWESLYGSVIVGSSGDNTAELWKNIEANKNIDVRGT